MKSRRSAKVEEVILYEEEIGDGKKEPYRLLTIVRAKDGSFIAERDHWEEACKQRKSSS